MDKTKTLNEIIKTSNYLVFLGGAGVSTESGIPDFRSKTGLYEQKFMLPAEIILSRTFFDKHPDLFFDFYFKHLVHTDVLPNITHEVLAKLEEKGILKAIITQNIDGLHEMAGSKCVYNLHGTIYKNHCMNCNKFYKLEDLSRQGIPLCSECGGIIKPDVVLYEEALDENVLNDAIMHIKNADTLIIAGTSLTVYPASSLVNYFKGKNLIIINKDMLNIKRDALVFNEYLGSIFNKIDI